MKEILIKAMNEKAGAYKDRGYNCIDAALSTVAYTAELALEAGTLPQADYAEVMKEYARLYRETLKEEQKNYIEKWGGEKNVSGKIATGNGKVKPESGQIVYNDRHL